MKTKTLSVFVLFISLFLGLGSAQARTFEVPSVKVSGLSQYDGPYISFYLVHGSKVFGQEVSVSKVYKVLGTHELTGTDEVDFPAVKLRQNWSNFRAPNYVVAVIHPNKKHALNSYGVIDGTPTVFDAPRFLNRGEQVEANDETKKLEKRSAFELKQVLQGRSFKM